MKMVWFATALIIVLFAINGTWSLVQHEYKVKDICPKLLGVPACYIVLLCFTGVLFSHVIPFNKSEWLYFSFAGVVTLIASMGTVGELTGMVKCPRTSGGTPMCFISLAICLSLLATKMLELRA